MNEKLRNQLLGNSENKEECSNFGKYLELQDVIDFIDQNFIGKEALERMLNEYKDYYNQSGDERNKGRHLACEDLIKIIKTS